MAMMVVTRIVMIMTKMEDNAAAIAAVTNDDVDGGGNAR